MSSTIQVILRDDLPNLGKSGELVKVRSGYARNFLIPRSLAVPATADNVRKIEHEKREAAIRAQKLRAQSTELAERISALTVTIARKVGEEDRLFGSVTAKDIEAALKEKGIVVDRKTITLESPLRTLGTFEVKAKLLSDVVATFKVEVTKAS